MDTATDESSQPDPAREKLLGLCATAVSDKDRRYELFGKLLSGTRSLLRFLTGSYAVFILILCLSIHWFAEKNITLIFLAFLPATIWLLPLAGLFLISLPISWRLATFQLLCAGAYVWFFMDYEVSLPRNPLPDERTLTVLSWNRGQHLNKSLIPFLEQTEPDIVVLQEAWGRTRVYDSDARFDAFPFVEGTSDFVVLSKYPIGKFTKIKTIEHKLKHPLAARFEIDFEGTPIALYAIHQPTLRNTLIYYRGGAFLQGILGIPGTEWGRIRAKEDAFWKERTRRAVELAESIDAETVPTVAAGDLNTPDHGIIYRAFATRLNDAHEKAGRGFGYTLPGKSDMFLSAYGPWLRLDYIFSSGHWRTAGFKTEKDRTSQHRAIAATLVLDAASGAGE